MHKRSFGHKRYICGVALGIRVWHDHRMSQDLQKPSHIEWAEWAQIVLDRLTTCVHVYSKPPYDDVFISEKARQQKNDQALGLLRRIHGLIDEGETPIESLADVAHHDEQVIDGLAVLMRETLALLPMLSSDMQKLLKSEWYDKCNGRIASELFRGPMGDLPKGIGSGYAEQGRLPEVLTLMLERERSGDSRQPRADLHRHGDTGESLSQAEAGPKRHTVDVKRRWADKNSNHLRSAGRVD